MLDEEYEDAEGDVDQDDDNIYCTGLVAGHKVVIVCLPGHFGTNPAAAVATQMQAKFRGIRFGLMVGIGGGVPSANADVRLGDIVVSKPHGPFGGVVQYDMGKSSPGEFRRTGFLNAPPQILLSAVTAVHADTLLAKGTLRSRLAEVERIPAFQRKKAGPDILFDASYHHGGGLTCKECNTHRQVIRPGREDGAKVEVHTGTIASGNQVMKSGTQRDQISHELGGVLCFEMEAAGLMNTFPCVVIRGICDYADSHKNDHWQPYAAGTAAAYAKELLSKIPTPAESDTEGQNELNVEEKRTILESLKFKRLGARKLIIKRAHVQTCKWLLDDPQYVRWMNATDHHEYNGLLWIKGKAGAGKSTLLKFAVESAQRTMRQAIHLSFFFNARGDDMEKSTIGLYRALLVHLLECIPSLQNVLNLLYPPGSKFNADREWDTDSLKMIFENAIQELGSKIVICFIDALDECEEAQIREMIRFFEDVGELSIQKGVRFSVCFSSRHYPHVTVSKGLELVLDDQGGHERDIANYIKAELKIGQSDVAKRMRTDLQKKASGIFMWVVLVIGILNKEFDRGRVHGLEQKLREIPNDLDNLFHDILTRDSDNTDDLVLCIQWVLFATLPLSPEELYYAVLSGNNPEALTTRNRYHVTKDVVERFVLDCSKGLVEIAKPDDSYRPYVPEEDHSSCVKPEAGKVQFIHESVRDFVLNENGLGRIWPQYKTNFDGQSHERLKQSCLNQISKIMIMQVIPPDIPECNLRSPDYSRASSLKLAQDFPFLLYATQNVLLHANISEEWGISQAHFLSKFPLRAWAKLDNMLKSHETRTNSSDVSLLYRLAELNCADLILAHFQPLQCLRIEKERYGCPVFAASALGNFAAIRAFTLVLSRGRARKRHRHELNDGHIADTGDRKFAYSREGGFLNNAAKVCPEDLTTTLIRLWRHAVEAPGSDPWDAIMSAGRRDHAKVVQLLLDDRVISAGDPDGKLAKLLNDAVMYGNDSIVRFLMSTRFCMDIRPKHLDDAFHHAVHFGHTMSAAIMLDKGANVNAQRECSFNAISTAKCHCRRERGHSVNALYTAICHCRKETALFLLEMGADVNAQCGMYGNALQAAVHHDYADLIKALVNKGANVNAQGGYCGNALQAASLYGKMEIAELLLESGADPNAPGPNAPSGQLKNALQAVSIFHHHSKLRLLLIEKGALNP
ncbi:uncharacterized protein J4E79_005822 [Alternaria viburni]|uniref:uncharacterized protein n=1 Tax=Alternaria viburni TaxID=566460 RepID=UPI0020C2D6EF|nr:uncharacterized protein J4E79_005822 [Alternaria viburni]KAI4660020.1 hypothetical protein J4E79_005822 [Alternaria viburni]